MLAGKLKLEPEKPSHSRPSEASSASSNLPGSSQVTFRKADSTERTAERLCTRRSSYAVTSEDGMARDEEPGCDT